MVHFQFIHLSFCLLKLLPQIQISSLRNCTKSRVFFLRIVISIVPIPSTRTIGMLHLGDHTVPCGLFVCSQKGILDSRFFHWNVMQESGDSERSCLWTIPEYIFRERQWCTSHSLEEKFRLSHVLKRWCYFVRRH